VVKATLQRMGFTLVKTAGWFGYWGKHLKSKRFKAIKPFQKINHFPMSFEIGRKDRLYKNWEKMRSKLSRDVS
jgi:tubulin polyglutamylase TTLL4